MNELDAPGGDALAALDSLASLGVQAKPAEAAIRAKIQKGSLAVGRENGEAGARFIDLAAGDLFKILEGN